MTLTILEVCDALQETMMDNDMEDLPVYLVDSSGAVTPLAEDDFEIQMMNEAGDEFRAVVVKR